MEYISLHEQIWRNNTRSVLLLLAFPCIILLMVWIFLVLLGAFSAGSNQSGAMVMDWDGINYTFLSAIPWVVGIVGIWFLIAYFLNSRMVQNTVHSRPLERKDNPRVYNIVENLCGSCGMATPQIYVVDDPQLNAFASGINEKSYAVTLTTGIINLLDDEELKGVIGHELTHIRNRDTRLLITSIIFVGIVATLMQLIMRSMFFAPRSRNDKNGVSVLVMLLIGLVCCLVAYLFTILTRFAISRKREYMADAGGAELCGNPRALASALRKISRNPGLDNVNREDVAQLFIMRPDEMKTGMMKFMNSLFSTHPDPEKRIALLEQY